jgi:hypothetical protein
MTVSAQFPFSMDGVKEAFKRSAMLLLSDFKTMTSERVNEYSKELLFL